MIKKAVGNFLSNRFFEFLKTYPLFLISYFRRLFFRRLF